MDPEFVIMLELPMKGTPYARYPDLVISPVLITVVSAKAAREIAT